MVPWIRVFNGSFIPVNREIEIVEKLDKPNLLIYND